MHPWKPVRGEPTTELATRGLHTCQSLQMELTLALLPCQPLYLQILLLPLPVPPPSFAAARAAKQMGRHTSSGSPVDVRARHQTIGEAQACACVQQTACHLALHQADFPPRLQFPRGGKWT